MIVNLFYKTFSLVDAIMNQQIGELSEIPDSTWKAYEHFLMLLNMEKYEALRAIKLNKEIKGYIIKRLYRNAIQDTREQTGVKLPTLWDHFGENEFGGYFPYFSPDYDNPIDIKKNNSIIT